MPDLKWNHELVDQLYWHFANQPGTGSHEYFWEPVPGWNVRRKDASTPPAAPGSGAALDNARLRRSRCRGD